MLVLKLALMLALKPALKLALMQEHSCRAPLLSQTIACAAHVFYKTLTARLSNHIRSQCIDQAYEDPMTKRNMPQFLVHSPKDNVGVIVVEDLKGGTAMDGVITEVDKETSVKANMDIPIGHKVALKDLKKGDTVIKYGEDVGRMIGDVKKGDHVHTQNMKTKRW